jgi:hypothetical protein
MKVRFLYQERTKTPIIYFTKGKKTIIATLANSEDLCYYSILEDNETIKRDTASMEELNEIIKNLNR